MQCYCKKTIFSKIGQDDFYTKIAVPCGKCLPCMINYANEWSLRCMLEMKRHEKSCCVTLTYDTDNLPTSDCGVTLQRKDVQLFLKRLRKKYTFRYFGCGEYGSQFGRPHYHIILFGVDFDDKRYLKHTNAGNVYTSVELSRYWQKGFATIGSADARTAGYCAKYLSKLKKNPDGAKNPFTMMSLKPSIGYGVLTPHDYELGYIWLNGKQCFIPRSFYRSLEREGFDYSIVRDLRASHALDIESTEYVEKAEFSLKKSVEMLDRLKFI